MTTCPLSPTCSGGRPAPCRGLWVSQRHCLSRALIAVLRAPLLCFIPRGSFLHVREPLEPQCPEEPWRYLGEDPQKGHKAEWLGQVTFWKFSEESAHAILSTGFAQVLNMRQVGSGPGTASGDPHSFPQLLLSLPPRPRHPRSFQKVSAAGVGLSLTRMYTQPHGDE